MAFENKKIEDVNDLIISGLESELNTRFRLLPKSFIRVLAKVLSSVFISLYRQQAWIFLQLFVDTATFDEVTILGRKIRPLVQWGELVGVGSPNQATQWTGKVKVSVVNQGGYLDQGTQFVSALTQKIYITTKSVALNASVATVPVKCTEAGTSGNLDIDDELTTVSPLAKIKRVAVVTDSTDGTDSESAENYRARVRQRWRIQPQGGSLVDYRKWASEVAGVRQTYIYKDDDSAAGVLIYVVADSDSRVAGNDLLVAVGESCSYDPETGEGRKPIGAVIDPDEDETYKNVKACTITNFDVYITDLSVAETASFKTGVKNSLETYFLEREPYVRGLSIDNERADRISLNNVIGIANDVAEGLSGHFGSVTMKKGGVTLTDYVLGKGELAELGNLYIDGEVVD